MSSRRPGFTILELLVAAVLFTGLLAMSYTLLLSGSRQQDFVSRHADLADQTRRAVRRLSKDIRSAQAIVRLDRQGTGLRLLEIEVPEAGEDSGLTRRVAYTFDRAKRLLARGGRPMLREVLEEVDLYAFDELGRRVPDEEAPDRLSYLRMHLEFGTPDGAPGKRRKLDLTLSPRVPASRVKAQRVLLERSLERFDSQDPLNRSGGTGDGLTTPEP